MKDTAVGFIVNAWQNKHTSTSAIVLFAATAIGVLWPQHKDKMDEIARAAIMYGLLTAGDAKASVQVQPPANSILAKT
jgi:hypothetical protein